MLPRIKGSIENRTIVIKKIFPKKTDFNEITDKEIKELKNQLTTDPLENLITKQLMRYIYINQMLHLSLDTAFFNFISRWSFF